MDNGADSYRRFLDGDDFGMVELVRDYKDGLLLYLSSYTGNLTEAEECVQETFIKLAVKMPNFSGKSSFRTWLYSIGRNIAVSRFRKTSRLKKTPLDEAADLLAETDLENAYLIEEQKITLYRCIRRLKADYRKVLILIYLEGFGKSEVCQIMHKTVKQVDNLLYNARKSLRSELEKEGFNYENL